MALSLCSKSRRRELNQLKSTAQTPSGWPSNTLSKTICEFLKSAIHKLIIQMIELLFYFRKLKIRTQVFTGATDSRYIRSVSFRRLSSLNTCP